MIKKIISIIWVVSSLVLFAGSGICKAQDTKLYEKGWPGFSFLYPAQWERQYLPIDGVHVLKVGPKDRVSSILVAIAPNDQAPLNYFSRAVISHLSGLGSDFETVEDKAVRLKDGMPAREIQLDWVKNDGSAVTTFILAVKKVDVRISLSITSKKGAMTEDLKAIAYTLKVDPDKDELVAVPKDIRQFLDSYADAMASNDIDLLMSLQSDQYLRDGATKADLRDIFLSFIHHISEYKINVTKCRIDGNKAYLAGYAEDSNGYKGVMPDMIIIRDENGVWRGYGNQKKQY